MMANTKRIVLIGCGVLAVLALLGGAGLAGLIWYASEDIQGVTVSLEQPDSVKVGDTFELNIHIANNREKDTLTVSDIDIGNDYIAGFMVVSAEPAYQSTMDVPLIDMRSFTFELAIPAKQTRTVKLKLKAVQEGFFSGDLDVTEGARSLTTLVQTLVEPGE